MAADFFFNFSLESTSTVQEDQPSPPLPANDPYHQDPVASRHIPILPFHEEIASCIEKPSVYSIPGTGMKLTYISSKQAHATITTTDIGSNHSGMELETLLKLSDSKHSDLIPGVYEGGLKVWECALDLVRYMLESDMELSGRSVLELGCGVGLPAIYSLMKGAKCVDFQDYNHEVINYITIPNAILNTGNGNQVREKCNFYSGDWSSIASVLLPRKYDIILTTETIYSTNSQPKLLAALKELSCVGTGVVYVAAKTFYFGVGGGVESFISLVDEDGTFRVCECMRIEDSVPRVILKLTHKT